MKKIIFGLMIGSLLIQFAYAKTITKVVKKEKFLYFSSATTNQNSIFSKNTLISSLQTNLFFFHFGKVQVSSDKKFDMYTPFGLLLLKKGDIEVQYEKNILKIKCMGDAEINYENQNLKIPNRDIYFFIKNGKIIYTLKKDIIEPNRNFNENLKIIQKILVSNKRKNDMYRKQLENLSIVIAKKERELSQYRKFSEKNPSYQNKVSEILSQFKSLRLSQTQLQKRLNWININRHFYMNELLSIKYFKKYYRVKYKKKLYKTIFKTL